MKKLILSAFLFYAVSAIAQTPTSDSTMQKASSQTGLVDTKIAFGDFIAPQIDGSIFTNQNLKDKVTFVNFWSNACEPCRAEFEALNEIYRKYKDNKDFQMVAFTFESDKDIARLRKEYKLTYPIIHLHPDQIYKLNFRLPLPVNMVVDRSGKIAYIKSGAPIDRGMAKQEFDRIYSKQIERLLLPQ